MADAAGQRVVGEYSAAIAGWIGQPRLTPANMRQIEASLADLQTRSTDHAVVLRRQLGQRLGAWQTAFDLAPPFTDVNGTFDASQVTVEDQMLHRAVPSNVRWDPYSTPSSPLVTRQACDLQVQFEVVFDPAWTETAHVGVVLNAQGSSGYQFQVHAAQPESPAAEPLTLGAAMKTAQLVRLTISRDGSELATREIPAEQLGTGDLRLRATRDLDLLNFQVNQLPPLTFQDIFPLGHAEPGRYGILWPVEVPIQRITAALRVLPAEPSPLEQGDRLYSQGDFDPALQYYRQQVQAAHGRTFEQEARFKEASCLLQLNRRSEAESILTQLAADSGERFPVLAGTRLWLLHLEDGNWQAADAAFASLSARFTYQVLATHVPYALRQRIVHITPATAGVNHFRSGSSDDIQMLERIAAVQTLLGAESGQRQTIDWRLLRSLHVAEHLSQSRAVAQRAIETSGLGGSWNFHEELTWLMRLDGQAPQALDLLNAWIRVPGLSGHAATRQKQLLIDKARTLAALERWDEAEADLLQYLRESPVSRGYYHHSSAWLMLGLLRERRGKPAFTKSGGTPETPRPRNAATPTACTATSRDPEWRSHICPFSAR
jgi:tetratricopeptide (TPR) repeat protein